MLYLIIFFAKIIEVSLTTVRTVLLTRGEKLYASVIGFFEVIIWLVVVGNVLQNIQQDPIKIFVYALGFACGNYVGSIIEEKLAIGLVTFNIITTKENEDKILKALKSANLGVTVVSGKGYDNEKSVLIVHAKRKRKGEIVKLIEDLDIKAVISIADTRTVYGGYGLRK